MSDTRLVKHYSRNTEKKLKGKIVILYLYLFLMFCRLAEELLEKETLSLPDIVDILGPRPYPIKESIMEYMSELRTRKEQEDEILAAEEKKAEEE